MAVQTGPALRSFVFAASMMCHVMARTLVIHLTVPKLA